MPHGVVRKDLQAMPVRPNLVDYDRARAEFSWDGIRASLEGLPGGAGLNIAHEAVDRHAAGPRASKVALRCLGRGGTVNDLTYGHLAQATSRFAHVLAALGTGRGDRVVSLLGRVPELYVTALGTLKHASVFCPMFSQFGPEPIFQRLSRGDARVLVTTAALYDRKVAALRDRLPALRHVLLVDADHDRDETVRALAPLMAAQPDTFTIPPICGRRHGPAPLHQRHDRPAQGRRARARGGAGPLRDRP
ncbi:MAG: AMP-binding protein [Vicinamibacterales bacterium]